MKRILFVDDEPEILGGLRRMLRAHRSEWRMQFCRSGEAALTWLRTEPVDVVVTDMRMPGMDGAALLQELRARSPRTVRIVLSGHADLEATMRSVCVSHQYLSKPCSAAELRTVIERACSLESLLSDTALQDILGNVGDLPVVPETYQALLVALAAEEVDLDEVGEIVGRDPAISAKILQLVNSSFFGLRREIVDIRQAATHLGVLTLRDLTLSAEVFRLFEDSRVSTSLLEEEQAHSLLTSRIARALVEDKEKAEEAALAGMLHDIGKLVAAAFLPTRLPEKGDESPVRGRHEAEEAHLGVSHAEIGAYLLGLWGMPYPIVEAVAHHHRPSRVVDQTGFNGAVALHVADALAREVSGTSGALEGRLDRETLARLGLEGRLRDWLLVAEEQAASSR